jgi:hypothetical protein
VLDEMALIKSSGGLKITSIKKIVEIINLYEIYANCGLGTLNFGVSIFKVTLA